MCSGEIEEVIEKIKKSNIKIIGIDSSLMLSANNLTEEQEISHIFKQLHFLCIKEDVTIFITSQNEYDRSNKKISFFGSQKAKYFIDMILHLHLNGTKNNKRTIEFIKNEENIFYNLDNIVLDRNRLIFKNIKNGNNINKNIIEVEIEEERIDKKTQEQEALLLKKGFVIE